MMYRFNYIIISVGLSLCLSGCALPSALTWMLQGEKSETDLSIDEEFNEEEFSEEEFNEEASVEEIPYTIEIYVESINETENYYVYAAEYNTIRIVLPEGVDANDLEVETTSGTIERTKEDSTLYRLFVKEPNLVLEIKARDKKSGAEGFLITETIELEIPALGFEDLGPGEIGLDDFKKQGQLVVFYDDNRWSICKCKGFKLTRIPALGNKITIKNNSEVYGADAKALVSNAVKGDIYIFDDIMVSCNGNYADKRAETLIYLIK